MLTNMHQGEQAEEEIDWTHFTFQHGFRQLPQQLQHQAHQPAASMPPSAFSNDDTKVSASSQSPSLSPLGQLPVAAQHPIDIDTRSESDATPPPPVAADPASLASNLNPAASQHAQQGSPSSKFKQDSPQRAQPMVSHALDKADHAEHAELKAEDTEEATGDIDMVAEAEEGQDSGEEGVDGQRLTRSRRGNAAGLYMLDHGSQLIPKKASSCMHHS